MATLPLKNTAPARRHDPGILGRPHYRKLSWRAAAGNAAATA
ncbi:MAG: hypothetical protein ACHP7C_09805 [Lysobacterales bacterium]|jgi:hypothetical protein